MKKQLVSLFAMACMVFATSCSQEEIVSQSTGNEVKVTFTADLRNDVKSRTVGEDTEGIDELIFAVYDENEELLPSLTQKVSDGKITLSEVQADGTRTATINVVLVKGQTYSFAFWAQDKEYTAYSFDPETATVSINYGQPANHKNADAFFAKVNNRKVTGSFEEKVTLKRPFAQVNFLTTQYDLDNAKAAGFEPDKSSIVVQNAATSLNVLAGTVEGSVEAKFVLEDWIKDESTTIKNSSNNYITWDGTNVRFSSSSQAQYACNFRYLATAYFLPTAATEGVTIATSMSAHQSTKASKAPVELSVPEVTAQRNYRTNIYGNLLTSNGTFYVTVDPGFDGDYSAEKEEETTQVVGTIEEANALFAEGETNVTITEAPTAAGTITLPNVEDDVTINFAFEENASPAQITITDGENTSAPKNIAVNGNAGDLVINAPNSTIALNGEYNSVTATTAANTLIVTKGSKITTLTLNAGNAEIYYGAVTTLIKDSKYEDDIIWTVDSKEQLAQIATDVNAGKAFKGETIALISDVDLNNEEWTPIGNSTNKFQGIFDGQEHIISNLVVNMEGKSNVGLFGYTTDGEIKNLTVNNAKVTGHLNVGVVAGTPYASKYTDIKVTGHVEVNGMSYVGGVGGKNAYANWTNITVDVDASSYVKANSVENGTAYRTYVGGVVGFNGEGKHSFTNIKSNINVSGSTCDVGGLFGIAHYGNNFTNCISSGNVEITNAGEAGDAEEIGGIAGVWHNGGADVVFTGCSFTGTLEANITEGVDLSDNTIVGAAYYPSGSYKKNGEIVYAKGKLNIDGEINVVSISVSTASDLSTLISEGANVVLANDVTYSTAINNDATIDLGGNAFEATTTIKLSNNANLTMAGGDYVVNSTFGHVDVRPTTAEGSVLTYENVNFSFNKLGKTYGPSTNRLGSVVEVCAEVAGAHTKILFKNCTFDNAQVVFEGMSGKTGTFEAVFENCTFNALTSSAPVYIQNNVEGTIEMEGCIFNLECTSSSASAVSVSSSSSTAVKVTATNNTINATAATPYTYDASKGETEEYNVKVNGTPANIKFISIGGTTSTATETGTTKTGIAL